MKPNALLIHPDDNILVVLEAVPAGATVAAADLSLTALDAVPESHKVARVRIPAGTVILRYGAPIGVATKDIEAGQWVHSHNLGGKGGA